MLMNMLPIQEVECTFAYFIAVGYFKLLPMVLSTNQTQKEARLAAQITGLSVCMISGIGLKILLIGIDNYVVMNLAR